LAGNSHQRKESAYKRNTFFNWVLDEIFLKFIMFFKDGNSTAKLPSGQYSRGKIDLPFTTLPTVVELLPLHLRRKWPLVKTQVAAAEAVSNYALNLSLVPCISSIFNAMNEWF